MGRMANQLECPVFFFSESPTCSLAFCLTPPAQGSLAARPGTPRRDPGTSHTSGALAALPSQRPDLQLKTAGFACAV